MSDDTGTPNASNEGGNQTSGNTPAAGDEFKPITSQEEFEQRLGKRLERERAKFSDYDDVKAKAAKLDEIEQANKSEAERLADEVTTAKAEAEAARAELLRYRVAANHGITDAEDIALFLTGTDEETLTKQAERLAAHSDQAGKPRAPKPDPNQGRNSSGTASTADQFAAAIGGQFTT